MASGNIRKRTTKKGVCYQITIECGYDPVTGKRERQFVTLTNCTKKQAEAELRKLVYEHEHGHTIKSSATKLATWLDNWLNTYQVGIAQTTRDGYDQSIKNYINPHLGRLTIDKISTNDVQSWVNALSNRGLSSKTVRNTYTILRCALEKLTIMQIIPRNPCGGVKLPAVSKYEAKVYSTDTVVEVLELAKGKNVYPVVILGALLGLRRGEIVALTWGDIDFSSGIVTVDKNRVHTSNGVILKSPKSFAGNRKVYAGSTVISLLRELRETVSNANSDDISSRPIVCKENGEPYHPDSVTQMWERFIAAQGLEHIRLHDLRHTNATALLASGASSKVVQKHLGHADIRTTLNTYAHVLPSMHQEAATNFDNYVFNKKSATV